MATPTRKELLLGGREVSRGMDHQLRRPAGWPLQSGPPMATNNTYSGEHTFGCFWARPGLSLRHRMMANLAMLTSMERFNQLRSYSWSAINLEITPEEIQEVLSICTWFLGAPVGSSGGEVTRDVYRERGIVPKTTVPPGTPQGPGDTPVPDLSLEDLEKRGYEHINKIMPDLARDPQFLKVKELAPDVHKYVVSYVYGGVLLEPGLSLKEKILVCVACLESVRRDPPLRYFVQAGLNAGWTRDEMVEILMQLSPYAGFPAVFEAIDGAKKYLGG